MSLDIERAKGELADLYFRQLEQGFPPGSMVVIGNIAGLLSRTGDVELTALMLEIRRSALHRLTMKRQHQRRLAS